MARTPESSPERPAITKQDLDSFEKVLNHLQKNDQEGTSVAYMSGELVPLANIERARLQEFEDLRAENEKLRRQLVEPPLYSRREFVIRSILTATAIPFALNTTRGLGAIKDDLLEETPEEKRRREEEGKRRELQSLEYKRDHLMTAEPSTPSFTKWTVRHPETSDDITYAPLQGQENFITQGDGQYIMLPLSDDSDVDPSTFMRLDTFDDPGSIKSFPRINVQLTNYYGRGSSPNVYEEFVIDPKLADEAVNPNVLEFRNIDTDQRIYASISRARTDDIVYNLQILERKTS